MDDSVFSSQFQAMRDAFAREGIVIEVAYTPSGRADYMYEAGRLLARAERGRAMQDVLPGRPWPAVRPARRASPSPESRLAGAQHRRTA